MMFGFFARRHFAHLEKEVAFWREQWRVERQRANMAFDRLLHEKNVAPITAPTMPDAVAETDVDRVRESMASTEFSQVGQG